MSLHLPLQLKPAPGVQELPVGAGQGSPGDLEPGPEVQKRLQGLKQGLRKPKHQLQGAALGAAQNTGYRRSSNN